MARGQLLVSGILALCTTLCHAADDIKTLRVPDGPGPAAPVVDGSFVSYSIEFANFHDFVGNASHPNDLTLRLVQNLANVAGSYPRIRIGGSTANRATYVSDQEQAILLNFTTPGADQPTSLTWGPSWLRGFDVLPSKVKYTLGLPFNSGAAGEEHTLASAKAAYGGLKDKLYAFQIGNEFDVFPVDRENQPWNIAIWAKQWLERSEAVMDMLSSSFNRGRDPIFQTGVFVPPGSITSDTTWTPQAAIENGVTSQGTVNSFSIHQYFGAACYATPTLASSILNHTWLETNMRFHEVASNFMTLHGIKYIIGETNSIACQGLTGVSDVFGSALWAVDYALYAASLNVSSLHFHMGTGYRYSAWQPRLNGTTLPGPRPLYYGHLVAAEALAGGNKQVKILASEPSFSAYGIYTNGSAQKLRHIVLVDLREHLSSAAARPTTRIRLPRGLQRKGQVITAKRLSAPGVDAKTDIEWAGQRVSDEGNVEGEVVLETVKGGDVELAAGEVVMLSFTPRCKSGHTRS